MGFPHGTRFYIYTEKSISLKAWSIFCCCVHYTINAINWAPKEKPNDTKPLYVGMAWDLHCTETLSEKESILKVLISWHCCCNYHNFQNLPSVSFLRKAKKRFRFMDLQIADRLEIQVRGINTSSHRKTANTMMWKDDRKPRGEQIFCVMVVLPTVIIFSREGHNSWSFLLKPHQK